MGRGRRVNGATELPEISARERERVFMETRPYPVNLEITATRIKREKLKLKRCWIDLRNGMKSRT